MPKFTPEELEELAEALKVLSNAITEDVEILKEILPDLTDEEIDELTEVQRSE